MRCADVREWLAAAEEARPGDVEAHMAGCAACTAYAARTARVDALARTQMVVEPSAELQMRLMELVNASYLPVMAPRPVPAAEEAARRAFTGSPGWGAGIAAMLAAVAGWRVYGIVDGSSLVVGNVVEAAQVVVASPAVRYLTDLPLTDVGSLAMWGTVAAVAWSISPSGPLREVAQRLGLPA
jgi:hypothetical protein